MSPRRMARGPDTGGQRRRLSYQTRPRRGVRVRLSLYTHKHPSLARLADSMLGRGRLGDHLVPSSHSYEGRW